MTQKTPIAEHIHPKLQKLISSLQNITGAIKAMQIILAYMKITPVLFLLLESQLHLMAAGNLTRVSEFLFLGLAEESEL